MTPEYKYAMWLEHERDFQRLKIAATMQAHNDIINNNGEVA